MKRDKPRNRTYDYLVNGVLERYIETLYRVQMAPISAVQYDPEAPRPMNPYLAAEFVVDIEKVFSVLDDSEAQQKCLEQMLAELAGTKDADKRLSLRLRARVVEKLGVVFHRRGLGSYFRKVKR